MSWQQHGTKVQHCARLYIKSPHLSFHKASWKGFRPCALLQCGSMASNYWIESCTGSVYNQFYPHPIPPLQGPFFLGQDISLVDITFTPMLEVSRARRHTFCAFTASLQLRTRANGQRGTISHDSAMGCLHLSYWQSIS